jgi:hypothetical protein
MSDKTRRRGVPEPKLDEVSTAALISRSSLGTPAARRLRSEATADHIGEILFRRGQLTASDSGESPMLDAKQASGAYDCPMLAIDISAFNDPRRGEYVQRYLRAAMYQMLVHALSAARLPWPVCYHEDRGDGVLVVAPPGTPPARLIDPLVDHLRADLRQHNKISKGVAAIRLRMSVNVGQVHFDRNGVSGTAVNDLYRLLEAASFKRVFAASGSDFALVASDTIYTDVISEGPGLIDPDMYAPISIRCKETRSKAWLYLPPVRNPVLRALSGRRGQPASSRSQQRANAAEAEPAATARSSPPGWLTPPRHASRAISAARTASGGGQDQAPTVR